MMFRDHRQVFPVVIVTVVRRCRSVAPAPEYMVSGDYRSSAPAGSAQGPSSHLTVADYRRPDAVSPQKCTRSTLNQAT